MESKSFEQLYDEIVIKGDGDINDVSRAMAQQVRAADAVTAKWKAEHGITGDSLNDRTFEVMDKLDCPMTIANQIAVALRQDRTGELEDTIVRLKMKMVPNEELLARARASVKGPDERPVAMRSFGSLADEVMALYPGEAPDAIRHCVTAASAAPGGMAALRCIAKSYPRDIDKAIRMLSRRAPSSVQPGVPTFRGQP
jgi:hypothetical protein